MVAVVVAVEDGESEREVAVAHATAHQMPSLL
jgi:hypothetical protein